MKVVTSRRRSVRTHPVSALSPSRAKDYLQCPRLFFYKTILGLKTPPSEATLRGTLAHFAFERIFDHPPEDRNVSLALEYVDAAWDAVVYPLRPRDSVPAASASARLRDAEDRYRECHEPGSASETRLVDEASSARALVPDDRREGFLESVRTAVRGWFAMENPTKFTPTERELYVRARIGAATIHGYVDRFDSVPARDGAQRNYVSDYKGLSLETPLPTPTGWTTMGRVSVGDFLLGTSGEPVKVTDKTPEQRLDCFELLFEDGTTIVADTVHLWETLAPVPGIHSTAELAAMLATAPQAGVLLPGLRPPRLPEKELVLSPVEAGRLVGLRELLSPLSEEFRTLAAVARSSHVHRLEFLRGLLQVPISPGRVEVRDEVVAAIVSEIVVLSGLRPRPWSRTDGVMHMEFTREELAARVLDRDTAVPRRVVAIRPVASVTTCCISVDAEDSLYCAGRGMVPTHNTGKKPSERFQDEAFFQLEVYALALAESGNVETHQLRLVYTNEADPKGVLVRQVTPQLLDRTREKIRDVWDGIGRADRAWHEANLRGDDAAMEKAWEGKKQRLCDWCHFGPKHTNVCSTWNPSVAGMLPEEQELRISARPGNRIASGEATSFAADG